MARLSRSKRLSRTAITVMLAAGLGGCTLAGSTESDPSKKSIDVGFMYDVHAANVWTMDQCESDTVSITLTPFKQFAEIQRGLERGQLDAAMMGYQNLGQMLDNGFEGFRAVSGVYRGGEHIVVRAGSGITSWNDLRGKKIGVPPNSFVEMLLRASLREAGVDVAGVELVPFAGAGPPLQTALRNGEVDALVAWEPNGATAITEGFGAAPPFDIQDGSLGDATSLMYVSSALHGDQQAVDALVSCLRDRTEKLSADTGQWVTALQARTGLGDDVARAAVRTGTMDIALPQASAERIIREFAANGLLSDTSGRVAEFFDYGPLERVTGAPVSELGKG
ncbi:ABC transporter substrate-binding protein [Nocardia sp. BMG51109]|uniref:ABC transporter substrate-binding protein n=1 Tax=Nocardia sp. BMG51109 TaxID=1056816 RepID=UPI0018DC5A87|nr:ABC transporter substrate-binding protein [Nocardia sp. BMG51109]